MIGLIYFFFFVATLSFGQAFAGKGDGIVDPGESETEELARAVQNPIASLISLPFYVRVLGASGAVFGILGMLGILRPKLTVWLYAMPMPMIVALIVWGIGDVIGIYAPSGTANIAHLGGLSIGLLFGFYYRKQFKEKRAKKEDVYIDEEKVKEWEKSF